MLGTTPNESLASKTVPGTCRYSVDVFGYKNTSYILTYLILTKTVYNQYDYLHFAYFAWGNGCTER